MVVAGQGGIGLPFHGVHERDAVEGIEHPAGGETVLLRRRCPARGIDRHRLFNLVGRLRQGGHFFLRENVEAGQIIVLDALDQLGGVGRVRGIAGLLEAVGPALVVRQFQVEEEFVAVPVTEEIRVVPEAFLRGVVHAETLSAAVVIHVHGPARPVLVALDAKVVVALCCQGGEPETGLQDALGQGDAGRNARALHLLHRQGGIRIDILLLRGIRPLRLGREAQGSERQRHQYFFHHFKTA